MGTNKMGEKKGKKKGMGGLTPEKKRLLKQMIMQKAAEDLKKKQEEELKAKMAIITKRVAPLEIEGLGKSQLESKVKELYKTVCALEEEKYDWEFKIRRQEYELNELSIKVNDIKGKFVKPVLKKVAKPANKLAKFDKSALKSKMEFRDNLKSTGKDKYALEEEEAKEKPDWSAPKEEKRRRKLQQ